MQELITSYSKHEVTEKQSIHINMLDDFISFIDASPRTVETYTRALRQFINYLSANGITQPIREDVVEFRESLKVQCKASTVQNYIVAVRLFFQWTYSRGIYPNIAENLKGAKVSKGHKKDYLTSKQIKRVLSTIDTTTLQGKRDYAIVSLMVTAGLRDTEVSNANIEDLRTVGDFTALFVLGKGKEEKADYVKIVEPVEDAIRDYLKELGGIDPKQPLFISLSNNSYGNRVTTRSVSRICKNALIAAGYNSDRLTAHSLRHTAVTLSLLGGKSLQEVQQFARHSNIATTQIYAHNLDRVKNDCEAVIAKAIF